MKRKMPSYELLEDFLASRAAANRSPRTIAWYRFVLRQLIDANGGQLPRDPEPIERWLATSASPAYQRSRLSAVRAFYSWATERKRIRKSPARVIRGGRRRALPRIFNEHELRAIIDVARRSHPRDYAAVLVLLDTGVRIGELVSLTTGRIHAADILVTGKTGDRWVPISPAARAALLRITLPDPHAPVFRALDPQGRDTGSAITADAFGKRLRQIALAAGVTGAKLGPHTFRHTFATSYLRNGGNIYKLALILGHSSVTTTEIYLHLAHGDLADEHARMSPLGDLLKPRQWTLEPVELQRGYDDHAHHAV